MATLELLLGVEHLLAVLVTEAATGTTGTQQDLVLRAILLCQVGGLKSGVAVRGRKLMELELVDAVGVGEGEEGEGGEGDGEEGGEDEGEEWA